MSLRADEVIDRLAADPQSSALCCDFDGTLAEIVDDPAAARPLPGVVGALEQAARRMGAVAVVSGRPLAFLESALAGARHVALFGLYGAEARLAPGASPVPSGLEAEAARWLLGGAIAEVGPLPPGTELERKGLSFALHWRRAPEYGPELELLGRAIADRHGLEALPGKMAIELAVPGMGDKGQAVRRLAAGMRTACFVGDDQGDLAAFGALGDLEAGGTVVVRVAIRSAEAPPELLASADLVLDGPAGAASLLSALVERLGGEVVR